MRLMLKRSTKRIPQELWHISTETPSNISGIFRQDQQGSKRR